MNKPVYLRGGIYYADLGEGFGSEQQGWLTQIGRASCRERV